MCSGAQVFIQVYQSRVRLCVVYTVSFHSIICFYYASLVASADIVLPTLHLNPLQAPLLRIAALKILEGFCSRYLQEHGSQNLMSLSMPRNASGLRTLTFADRRCSSSATTNIQLKPHQAGQSRRYFPVGTFGSSRLFTINFSPSQNKQTKLLF